MVVEIQESVERIQDTARRIEVAKPELDPYDLGSIYLEGREVGFSRTEAQILADRREIAKLLRKGYDTFTIWEQINKNYSTNPLAFATIQNDIRWLKTLWLHDAREDIEESRAELIDFWKNLMRTYWEGYQRSLGKQDVDDPTKPGYKYVEEQTSKFFAAELEEAKITGKTPKHNVKDIKIKKYEVIGGERWLAGVERCLVEIGKLKNAYPKAAFGDATPATEGTDVAQTPAEQSANILFSLIQLARQRQENQELRPENARIKRLLPDGTVVEEVDGDVAEEFKDIPVDLDTRMEDAVQRFMVEVDKKKEEEAILQPQPQEGLFEKKKVEEDEPPPY